MAKFQSEAHSLIFYPDPVVGRKGSDRAVFFSGHVHETDDSADIEALSSDRAKACGIVAVESEDVAPVDESTEQAPAAPPA